jgi:hypothetical protein
VESSRHSPAAAFVATGCIDETVPLPLLIVVAIVLVAGFVWRARSARRLTVEESVDRYRRTLGAVHDAATRASPPQGALRAPSHEQLRRGSGRRAALASSRNLGVAAIALVTVGTVGVVIATHHAKPKRRATAPTTVTARRPPRPTTTTRPAATTTSQPLVRATGAVDTFTVSKPSYDIVVQAVSSACWVDMRGPTGTSLFTGTLSATQSQSITASTVMIKLGNPAAVTVSIDGMPVSFTISNGSLTTLHFQGTAAGA